MFVAEQFSDIVANPALMHDPMYYSVLWTFVGILFIGIVCLIIFMVFYFTRKKTIKTIANLKPIKPMTKDINAIRQKYLLMVDEVEQRFGMRKIRAAKAHQELSLVVRLFYAEICGFHAEVLTLSDLKRSNNVKLANLIEKYYPDEFSGLDYNSVLQSSRNARELIMDNEAISKFQQSISQITPLLNRGGRQ